MGWWGPRVCDFFSANAIQCLYINIELYLHMAYFAILSISFVHDFGESKLGKVLNPRGGWGPLFRK